MTDSLTFDLDAVTPRMLVEFKQHTGENLMALMDEKGGMNFSALSGEILAGVVWLALRMSGRPDATFDEALDTPLASLDFGEPSEDPT